MSKKVKENERGDSKSYCHASGVDVEWQISVGRSLSARGPPERRGGNDSLFFRFFLFFFVFSLFRLTGVLQRSIRDQVRNYCQSKLQPRVQKAYREEVFDRDIMHEMGSMGMLGSQVRSDGEMRCESLKMVFLSFFRLRATDVRESITCRMDCVRGRWSASTAVIAAP